MNRELLVLGAIVIIVIIAFLMVRKKEGFCPGPPNVVGVIPGGSGCDAFYFVEAKDTEFRGMNLLGVNSLDTHVTTNNAQECQAICRDLDDCQGYGYYAPSRGCFLFGSGGFVPGRPGFTSGVKMFV